MPDIEAFYDQFEDRGLVILAISQEDAAKVKPFVAERSITYPILLDPGGKGEPALRGGRNSQDLRL
jgi:peroxiredoxin